MQVYDIQCRTRIAKTQEGAAVSLLYVSYTEFHSPFVPRIYSQYTDDIFLFPCWMIFVCHYYISMQGYHIQCNMRIAKNQEGAAVFAIPTLH